MILKEINTYNIKIPRGIGYLCDIPFIATEKELYLGNDMILNTQLDMIAGIYCGEYMYLRDVSNLKIVNHEFNIIDIIKPQVNNMLVYVWDIKINYNDQFIISDCYNNKVQIFSSSFDHIKTINISNNISLGPVGIEIDIENKLYVCSNDIKIYDNNKCISHIDIQHPDYLCFYKNNLITINYYSVYYNDKIILKYEKNYYPKFIAIYNNKLSISILNTNKVIEYEIIEER